MSSHNSIATVLVTGAGGQLGSEIRSVSELYPSFCFLFKVKEDLPIENPQAVQSFFAANRINYCINCAAYTAVDKAESEEQKAFLINADAVGVLAGVCHDHGTRFIHISTDYVYDGSRKIPLKEDNNTGPVNTYGRSKLKGEELALGQNPAALIIRTSWVYSSFGNNFVKTMLRLFKERSEISVIDDQFGSPTYAADLARVIMNLIEKMEGGEYISGIFNYCNDGQTSWYQFAEEIKALVRSTCKINPIPASSYAVAAKRPAYSVLDTSKIKKVLHSAIPSWKKSLENCITLLSAAD